MLFLAFALWTILSIGLRCFSSDESVPKYGTPTKSMREKCQKIVYGCFIFEIAAAFIIGLALAAYKNNIRANAEAGSFSPISNSFSLLIAFGILSFIFAMQYYGWKVSNS